MHSIEDSIVAQIHSNPALVDPVKHSSQHDSGSQQPEQLLQLALPISSPTLPRTLPVNDAIYFCIAHLDQCEVQREGPRSRTVIRLLLQVPHQQMQAQTGVGAHQTGQEVGVLQHPHQAQS